MLTAAICTIGDEILIGQIVDTNSSHISRALNSIGVKVRYMNSFGDERSEIISNLDQALSQNDIVIVTGGLGPTKDDITKSALAELYGSTGFYQNEAQFEIVKRIVTRRGIELSDLNRAQASVPQGSIVIPNQLGTAPCIVFRFPEERYPHRPTLYSLPGVPFEAIGLLPDVISDIKSHYQLADIHHKTLVTFGIPESTLAKQIEPWEDALPEDIKLAYLPNPIVGVRLRLSTYGGVKDEEIRRIDTEFEKLREMLGDAIYGEGEDTLQIVIGKHLKNKGMTLSAAESCTGGKIASLLTSVAGASQYFYGSVTSYDNSIKENILGVPHEIIAQHGAVSQECVEAMAKGVNRIMNTDFAVATSGIAGPGGGTPEKPVGTAWLAVAYRDRKSGREEVISKKVAFNSSREVNIDRFASNALNLLRLYLESH